MNTTIELTKKDEEARRTQALGGVVAALYVVLAVFQAAIAFGAPVGRAAWGGGETSVPDGLRVASGVAVLVWGFAALVVLGRAGYRTRLSARFCRIGTWVLFAVSLVAILMNAASKSPWERYGWAPFSFVLAILTFILARSPETDDDRTG